MQQIEQLTGVQVDHFVVVDFNGFKDMVDAINGVEVCLPEDVDDDIGHIHLKAGTREVKGKEALDYVRVRHAISQQRRHRPDEAPAGVHRGDGQQGDVGRHPGQPRPR